jgi:hypothetical protein
MHERRTPPQTKTHEERIQAWVRTLLPLITVGLLAYGGVAFLQELRTPPSTSALSQTAAVSPSLPASPIVVQFPSEMAVVTHTPIPETPEPAPPPKATPFVNLCGPWLKMNEVCTMNVAPPTATPPLPDCPTVENRECVWKGGKDADVPIIPTPGVSQYGGSG